jgi:cobalt-zinc-cadmium efflux system outer membrane protein
VLAQPAPESLALSKLPGDDELAVLVWERAPELSLARVKVGQAQADVTRAHQLPNPNLDLGWNTLAVGETNPPGLPFTQTSNVAVQISELVELGKRGPRQDAARASYRAATLDALELLRQRTLDLLEQVAQVASSEIRLASLGEAAVDAERLAKLQAARASTGDTAGLDTQRARLEYQKIQSTLGAEREHLEQLLLECGRLAGQVCEPFGDVALARQFLARGRPAHEALTRRPDLRSLEAQVQAADAQAALSANKAIPDPTFRVGYVRDEFVISGNTPNSLLVGVSLPLPVFDHGQADAEAARVQARASSRAREQLLAQAERDVQRLQKQLTHARERQATLATESLPLAREVIGNLEKAVLVGSPVQDLLLARRTLQDLTIDSVEVDLLVYHLALELERARGEGPKAPALLSEHE